jgi:RNA polymerase sigma-70 factor (ECF subfamily)
VLPQGTEIDLELRRNVTAAQSGDAEAFGTLYTRYAGVILRYLRTHIPDIEAVQDLTQEVFVRVIKDIGGFTYGSEKSFLSWLYAIANHVLVDQAQRKPLISRPLNDDIEIVDSHDQDTMLVMYDRVPFQQAVSQLTRDQQQVLTLKFFANMTNKEIAAMLGRSEGAVKALQHRGLQALQRIIERQLHDTELYQQYAPLTKNDLIQRLRINPFPSNPSAVSRDHGEIE